MKTIILSAGHGGRDPGAVGNGVRESEAVLQVCLYCRDHLNRHYEGHKLVLPRTTNKFVSLPARRDIARDAGADLYVSIHMNSFNNPSANGFETFTHSGPLYETTLNYQKIIHETVYSYMQTLGVRDRGRKRADHYVTRVMPCPTVLIEYLFISNPREAEFAKDSKKLAGMGRATAEGIAKALNLQQTDKPVEPGPLPEIQRTIAVKVDGRDADMTGYLIDNRTYLPALDVCNIAGVEVTGHGDFINIRRPRR